jgi:hypothetical protein
MSHSLEKNADTKYHDYTEPKTSTHRSTTDYKNDEEHQASSGDIESQDAESIWKMSKDSAKSNRGSFADEQRSVENITTENEQE